MLTALKYRVAIIKKLAPLRFFEFLGFFSVFFLSSRNVDDVIRSIEIEIRPNKRISRSIIDEIILMISVSVQLDRVERSVESELDLLRWSKKTGRLKWWI